jgi:adenine specific DNA methylase Mod
MHAMPGDLYYGDNLDVMRRHIASESVDLIYLDPPFNSDRTYNLIHKGSQAQERAFVDTWTWDDNAENAFRELTDRTPQGVHVPRPVLEIMLSLRG